MRKRYGDTNTSLQLTKKARRVYDETSPVSIYECDDGTFTLDFCGDVRTDLSEKDVNEYLEEFAIPDKEQIVLQLLNFASNSPHPILEELQEEHGNKIASILAEFEQEWNNAPCDPEGATAEQDANMDAILDKYADEIMSVING